MGNTQNEIRDRMLDAIPADFDKSEGSFFYDAIMPAAIELALAHIRADKVLSLGFAETTSGTYLDYRAHEHGIERKPATKASGQVTITGAPGSVIPLGSLFATSAGIQFQTTAEAALGTDGTATINVTAVEAGLSGNMPAGVINTVPVSIAGVTGVTNINPTDGGVDRETDTALLARLLDKVRQPATSGNIYHYWQWALEVAGVGDARVQPLWNGNGTVRIIVIDSNKQPASADIIQDVAVYLETVRPIGATVSVISATGLSIDVSADVTLASDATLDEVQLMVEASINDYLKEIAFKQDYVSLARIGSIILDTPGVLDYSNLMLNTGTSNVTVTDTRVAVFGTVTLV